MELITINDVTFCCSRTQTPPRNPKDGSFSAAAAALSSTLLNHLVFYARPCAYLRLAVLWVIVPKNPLIFSTTCQGVNGFLITASIRVDGKTASNSRLFTSNMVIIMTFISGRRSFTFLISWKPVNAGILTSDTKTWPYSCSHSEHDAMLSADLKKH